MSTRKMKGPFGSFSVAVVVFAVVLGTAGLIWAHWYTSLRVEANINTGNVGMEWLGFWTNDDGDDNGDGEDGSWPEYWDNWGEGSSADPSDFGDSRYDKDVGACWAHGGGDNIHVQIENGYPSYHCRITAELQNTGSVPVRAMPSQFSMARGYHVCDWYDAAYNPISNVDHDEGGPYLEENGTEGFQPGEDIRLFWMDDPGFYWGDVNENGEYDDVEPIFYEDCYFVGDELAWEDWGGQIAWGYYDNGEFMPEIVGFLPGLFGCGEQIDPGFFGGTEFGFHVEQAAEQGSQYYFEMHQEFVNWNEFDDTWCVQ